MRLAAGRRLPRALVALLLLGAIGLSNSSRGSAQAPPEPPQRWDGLIERLSSPGQWYYPESFVNPRMSRHGVSGDGRYFVFMAEVPNPPYAPTRELFIRDRSTGDTRRSGPGPLHAPPAISSDGNHLALELCDPVYRPDDLPICDVWTLDTQTLRMENMATPPLQACRRATSTSTTGPR